jgi:hypothetical protein
MQGAIVLLGVCSVLLTGSTSVGVAAVDVPAVAVEVARGTERELRTKRTLEQVFATYDLKKYTFARRVMIEEAAINHAFPVLTLNVRFASSADELLSSYVHEQLHWHLRERQSQQQAAIAELRRMYPAAPIGMPEGAETAYSTYGHLVTCYLEIVAARELLGPVRAATVTANKGHYTWIYATVLRDETKIARLVEQYRLGVK